MQKLITEYLELRKKMLAMNYAMYMIGWDSETEAPEGCFTERGRQVGVLSEMGYNISMSKEAVALVTELYQNMDKLDARMQVEIKHLYKRMQKKLLVPSELLINFDILLSGAAQTWAKAKQSNNYELFAPTLKKIIDFTHQYINYIQNDELKGYNVLLDEYEEGSNVAFYDEFFETLKKEIVPLVKKINEKGYQYNDEFASRFYNVEGQKEIAKYLMQVMGFDFNRGLIKESEHPFTSGFGTSDVRITTHYYENMLISSIFSVIHETGHATYEQQCNPELDETLVGGGTTMAMHESQSRFYENMIGRSLGFWKAHFPKLKEIFPNELKDVTVEEFYHAVNKVECSLIRTEADELTYPLHIMVRYELEKQIVAGTAKIEDLPAKWNELYKEYLGIDVPSDAEGVLQDVHWSGGSFGYFPTYALGSAYAAQLYYAMQKDFDIEESLKDGNLQKINAWLKEHVHQYGGTLTPAEILLKATGEKFNPQYYVKYLKDKYTKLYCL